MFKQIMALIVFFMAAGYVQAGVKVGQAAPDFTLADSFSNTHSLNGYQGKTIVLEWTNHDCPYVRKHYDSGNMQSLQKFAADNNVVWLSVISSAPGKQGHVTAEQSNHLTSSRQAAPSAVLFDSDGQVGRLYGARTTPHMFIINATGTLVYMGGIDSIQSANPADISSAKPFVKLALNEVLSGKPVTTPITRPYGCSVKY
jgi:peroxiredoxin